MAEINLTKGANVNLAKEEPGVTKFLIGLGWNASGGSNPWDLDASVFPCRYDADRNPILIDPKAFVYFNNLVSKDGAIVHSGDNTTGDGDGDDEQITVDISKLNPEVDEIIVAVTIYDGAKRGQNFGGVRNAYIRVADANNSEQASNPRKHIARYDLSDDAGPTTALQFGSFYKDNSGSWRFKALGHGANATLGDFVAMLAPGATITGG